MPPRDWARRCSPASWWRRGRRPRQAQTRKARGKQNDRPGRRHPLPRRSRLWRMGGARRLAGRDVLSLPQGHHERPVLVVSGWGSLRARVCCRLRWSFCLEATAPLRMAALSIALSLIVRLGQCRLRVRPALRRRRSSNAAARAPLSLSREFALVDDCRLHWLSDTLTDCRARRSRRSARRPSTCPGDPAVSRAHRRRCC